jgi:hypothetical protein
MINESTLEIEKKNFAREHSNRRVYEGLTFILPATDIMLLNMVLQTK